MRKAKRIAAAMISMSLLIGCASDTRSAGTMMADKYAGAGNYTLVDTDTIEKDDGTKKGTVWTFEEKGGRGLRFHVYEHNLTAKTVDGGEPFEFSDTTCDYDAQAIFAYIDGHNIDIPAERKYIDGTDCMKPFCATFPCGTHDDIIGACGTINDIIGGASDENIKNNGSAVSEYSMEIQFDSDLIHKKFSFGKDDGEDAADIDEYILEAAICSDDDAVIGSYDAAQVREFLEGYDSRIMVKRGNKWEDTGYVAYRQHPAIKTTAFFNLAKEMGMSVTGAQTVYSVSGADGSIYLADAGNTDEIPFADMEKILGHKVAGSWELPPSE